MDDAALSWLIENRGTVVGSVSGLPLAVSVEPGRAIAATTLGGKIVVPKGEQFVRKLRRRVELEVHSLADEPASAIEKKLFASVYKGVTDVVTKWVWPWPAFHFTRLFSRVGITPNMVTLTGVVLVFVAGWLLYEGRIGAALAAAWLMCFFDTVDGKLARVTATSTKLGDKLDHGTDIIHPPIWWYCLAHGIVINGAGNTPGIWGAFWIILACYLVGRAVEIGFKSKLGLNQFIWRPFDSWFRLIVSRRNIILLIMTVGLALRAPAAAYWACAIWSVISAAIQLGRFLQALAEARRSPIKSWLW
jgi:phosphatidylglycerophosphate synthase